MRTWIWTTIVGALLLIAAVLLSIKPTVRWLIDRQAEERGLELSFERLQLRPSGVRLLDVRLKPQGVAGVQAEFDDVQASVGFTAPRLRSLTVVGGKLELEGSATDLRAQLEEWRQQQRDSGSESPSSGPSGSGRQVRISDVDVLWRDPAVPGKVQRVQGLQVESSASGVRFGADLVELEFDDLSIQIAGAQAQASSLSSANIRELGAGEMRVQWRPEEPAPNDDGPSPAADPPEAQEPPSVADLDESSTPPSENLLQRFVSPHPERRVLLAQSLELVRQRILPRLPKKAEVKKLWLSYQRGEDQMRIGPNRMALASNDESVELRMVPTTAVEGSPFSFVLRIPRVVDAQKPETSAALSLEVKGGPVRLSTLGVEEGAFSLANVAQTSLQGTLTADLLGDASSLRSQTELTVQGLTLDNPKLSESLVSFPRLYLEGGLHAATDGTRFALNDVEIGLGEARFEGELAIALEDEGARIQARAQAPLVSCQALIDSAPRGLLGAVELMRFDGTFSLQASVDAHTRKVSDMRVTWNFDNGCKARAVPSHLSPDQFRGSFRRDVLGAGGFPMEIEFGPHSGNWVPYERVTPHVEAAILVCEDGRFFRHDGFDDRAIESAISANTKAGQFVRGASTVSMQLAKNLYLSRDKTLSRKFQEAALTSLLEQSFEKSELLELYVNVVEFGPGIYGISQAAAHYFDKSPSELSTSQAFFLISLLPAPTRDYFEADGSLKDFTLQTIRRLMKIAHSRGRLTDEELQRALLEEPRFGEPEALPPGALEQLRKEQEEAQKDRLSGAQDPRPLDSPDLLKPPRPLDSPDLLKPPRPLDSPEPRRPLNSPDPGASP